MENLNDYTLINVHVFPCKDSEGNDTFCVKGNIQIDDEDLQGNRPPSETIFIGDIIRKAGEFVQVLREMLPKTGKWTDANGEEHDWCGLKTLAEGEQFGPEQYQAVLKKLEEMKFTTLKRGKFITVPFDHPMIQLYSQNLGRKKDTEGKFTSEPLYTKGHPVCYKGTNNVAVYREATIFVRCITEGVDYRTDQPISGWDWQTRLKSKERLYLPLSEFIKKKEAGTEPFTHYEVLATDMPGAAHVPIIVDPEDVPET